MDVRMPDGVVVQGVPDDITQAELLRRYQASKQPAISDPTAGMSGAEKFAAGAGKAVYDTGRGLAQALQTLVSAPKGAELVSQQSIDEAKRIDAPLMKTGAGIAGNVAGNLAMALGPAAGLSALGKAAQAPQAVALAQGLLAPQKALVGGAIGGGALGAIQPVASDESRAFNTLMGAGLGAGSTALANLAGRALGSKPPLLTQDQQDLIARAQSLGYELKPSEITGKRWQQNLEAAMAQHYATSGRMQEIGARNTQLSDDIVRSALERAGGEIDQPSAAAAAVEGFNQGMKGEQGRLGTAYRGLLDGTSVDLEQSRPALEALRQKQMALPETSRSPDAMSALNDLLGSANYTGKAVQAPTKYSVEPMQDDIITAIRKLGGINPLDQDVTALARESQFAPNPRLGPVWTKPSGTGAGVNHALSPDQMAQQLHDLGYLKSQDIGELTDKIADASMGKPSFSTYYAPKADDPLANAIDALTERLGQKQAPAAPSAGFIRDANPVDGNVAQILRSDYTSKSATAKGQEKTLFAGMKDAIDGAITAALPESSRGQFQAINDRYGIYAGLNALSPKQQDVFLNQLYRGSKSADQFYTFLGLAPDGSFKDVARGFLSRLVEKSQNPATGLVNAGSLGREIDRANPEAMRALGGEAGKTMREVGDIGRNVLREQVPNSGTAQRFLYNSLLSGSGLGLGGYFGSEQGGSPGAAIGGAVGMFAMPKAVQAAYLSNALRPLLTHGVAGRAGLLSAQQAALLPYIGRAGGAGLLGLLSQ